MATGVRAGLSLARRACGAALCVLWSCAGVAAADAAAAVGGLTQKPEAAGCLSALGLCSPATALDGAISVAVSADGTSVYVASELSDAVAVFDREPVPPPPPPPLPRPVAPAHPSPDRTNPLLGALSLSPSRFRAAARGASIVARGGRRVSYTLSEPAAVAFSVQRAARGRRVGGRCVTPRRSNRRARRCTRYRTLPGGFTHRGATGRNTLHFSGSLRDRRLPPGRYRLQAIATDAAGNASRPQRRPFRIVRR